MMMTTRRFCAVAVYLGALVHYCSSAVVFSEDRRFAEEENGNKIKFDILSDENVNKIAFNISSEEYDPELTELPLIEELKEGSDSSDSSDKEVSSQDQTKKNTFISNSDEDSDSKESNRNAIPKRNEDVEDSSSNEINSFSHSEEDSSSKKLTNGRKVQKRSGNGTLSSESNESSKSKSEEGSSSEESNKKNLIKRSLSSEIDSLNAIGKEIEVVNTKDTEGTDNNGTFTKETITSEPTEPVQETVANEGITKPSVEGETTESTHSETHSTTAVMSETTTEKPEQTEPTQSETDTTTGTENETTTQKEAENKIQIEDGTTLENEPQSTATDVTSTTESSEKNGSNSETEEGSSSDGTTNSTEVESQKPEENTKTTFTQAAMARVNKLSDQIRLVLFQYRNTHAVVIPGQNFFPDPMPLQDFQQSFSIGKMTFKNMHVFGLSNFTVEHVNTDVDRMQVYVMLHMKRLVILGNYTLSSFFSRAAGPFNVTLLDVDSEGVAEVATAEEGHLEATDSDMDMFTKDMRVDFKNMGFYGSLFQSAASTVGDVIFNSIKPQLLDKVNVIIRNDVNVKLKEFSTKFINKVAPVDAAVSEGRKYVRTHGYDPYHIKDHTFLLGGLVYVNVTEFLLEGLSKFFRVGNLSLSMDKGTIEIGVHVATEQLTGHCSWSGQALGFYTQAGKTNFTVHHLQARALVTQSLDIREKPKLADLDLELGWVKVTMDTPTSLHYMIQGIINAFPRLIRHIIVDSLEQPLKERIQEILDEINVESVVDENLPKLDTFGL